jgi:hypothetical protein
MTCAIGPSVNTILIIEPTCEKNILKLTIIFHGYSKFHISFCAIGPSVNTILIIEPTCEKNILKLTIIFHGYSKFHISFTLGLKIIKSPLKNLTHQGLFSNTKILPQSS